MKPSPSHPFPAAPTGTDSGAIYSLPLRPHRALLLALALLSMGFAWLVMTELSRADPWYNRIEGNLHNAVDALALNDAAVPGRVDHPGLLPKYLLALDYRVRHSLGILPVSNLTQLRASDDTLAEVARLLAVARTHNRMLVLLVMVSAVGFIFLLTRSIEAALFAPPLLAASSGLLLHGLSHRPEVMCAWLGALLLPMALWLATNPHRPPTARALWLFLAGLIGGFAVATKLPGYHYLAAGYTWCWIAALASPPPTASASATIRWPLVWFVLPLLGSVALLMTLHVVGNSIDSAPGYAAASAMMDTLRLASVVIGMLPLLTFWRVKHRLGIFLTQRGLELAVLGAGTLTAIAVGYVGLRLIAPAGPTQEYTARFLQFVTDPAPALSHLLPRAADPLRSFLQFLAGSPLLIGGTISLTLAVISTPGVTLRLKSFIGWQLASALTLGWFLAQRHFPAEFGVLVELPLVLIVPLALGAWGLSIPARTGQAAGMHWTLPALLLATLALLPPTYGRLHALARSIRTETLPPVSPLTVMYLYEHDALPLRYREIMRTKYGSHDEFTLALEKALALPRSSGPRPPPGAPPP